MNKKRICTIAGICFIIILLMELCNLNAGVGKNLNSNIRGLQSALLEISACLENESRESTEKLEIIKRSSSNALSSVREINFIAEKSWLYRSYCMTEAETFFLHLLLNPEMIYNEVIQADFIQLSKDMNKVSLEEYVYRYNLIFDEEKLKEAITEAEIRFRQINSDLEETK